MFLKIYDSELETFIQKFHQLWRAVDLDTHAGVKWVGLREQLGHAPSPVHCPFHPPRHRIPAYKCRQERRCQAAFDFEKATIDNVVVPSTQKNCENDEEFNVFDADKDFISKETQAKADMETTTAEKAVKFS